jgi:hypothetical protein
MRIRSAQDTSMLLVVGNFDVSPQTGSVTFPTAGTWYDYLTGNTITTTGASQSMTLQAGEFHIYLNRNLVNAVTTPVIDLVNPGSGLGLSVLPNPVDNSSVLELEIPARSHVSAELINMQGQKVGTVFSGMLQEGKHSLSISGKTDKLPPGVYVLSVQAGHLAGTVKVMIHKK